MSVAYEDMSRCRCFSGTGGLALFIKAHHVKSQTFLGGRSVKPLRTARTRGEVPATSPLRSLHEGPGRRGFSHEQFTRSVLRNKSQDSKWFKFVRLVVETKVGPCD